MFRFVFAPVLAGMLFATSVFAAGAGDQVKPVNPSKPPVARVKDAPPPVKKDRKKAKKASAAPVQHAPSGEAMPEREKRLLRECKGRPNAGACLGYAS
jgi:hypothetical protein